MRVVRLLSDQEDDPHEPVKLLEVNPATSTSGVLPIAFAADPPDVLVRLGRGRGDSVGIRAYRETRASAPETAGGLNDAVRVHHSFSNRMIDAVDPYAAKLLILFAVMSALTIIGAFLERRQREQRTKSSKTPPG